ncbi:hypothetical protein [Streptomyces sp. NPDC054952]
MAAGYQVIVFTDSDFGGSSKTFTADTPYVGDDLNDAISSVRVIKTGTSSKAKLGDYGMQLGVRIGF